MVTNLNFYGKLNRALNYATIAKNYFEGSGRLAMLKLKEVVSSILSFISKMVPVDSHLLLFETGLDKADDNPRVIYNYILVSKSNIWYSYDKEGYFNERGGEYYGCETELSEYVCDKLEELKKAIDSLDSFEMRALMDKKHKASMESIHKYTDGNASSRVVELIANKTGVKSE